MADPVLLFRYSALTFNGHRIHYDRDYVTKVEGYPGLIFHGPLQAAFIVEFAAKLHGGTAPKKFSYRGAAAAVRRQRVQRQRQRHRRRHGTVDREFGRTADHEGHRDVVRSLTVIAERPRSNPITATENLDCFVASLLAMTSNSKSEAHALSRKPAKTTAASVTVKQATLDLLRAFGIKKVFGNPGSTELPFLSDWPDDIDYVLGLQEASVIGMADGYAQATRNAGFVNLHSAAGVGNALGNIYTAHRNQTPLVITAGQQARSILPLQAFLYAERASEFPRPYVKFCGRAGARRGRAGGDRARLLRGDAAALRADLRLGADRRLDPSRRSRSRPAASAASSAPMPSAMKALVAALAASKRPALVVGPGVDRAQAVDLMVRVAEKAKAAVWVSPFSARCSFPERHPQFAGFLHASPAQLSDALARP